MPVSSRFLVLSRGDGALPGHVFVQLCPAGKDDASGRPFAVEKLEDIICYCIVTTTVVSFPSHYHLGGAVVSRLV